MELLEVTVEEGDGVGSGVSDVVGGSVVAGEAIAVVIGASGVVGIAAVVVDAGGAGGTATTFEVAGVSGMSTGVVLDTGATVGARTGTEDEGKAVTPPESVSVEMTFPLLSTQTTYSGTTTVV